MVAETVEASLSQVMYGKALENTGASLSTARALLGKDKLMMLSKALDFKPRVAYSVAKELACLGFRPRGLTEPDMSRGPPRMSSPSMTFQSAKPKNANCRASSI